jgi:hypothetical protein
VLGQVKEYFTHYKRAPLFRLLRNSVDRPKINEKMPS